MRVELGNIAAIDKDGNAVDLGGAPAVTTVNIPDSYTFDPNLDVAAFKAHLMDALYYNDGVTNFGNDEALLAVVHPGGGLWTKHSNAKPTWVACDENPVLAEQIGAVLGIPVGKPADVEDTHWTLSGPPGINMSDGPRALLVNTGRDQWAKMQGGFVVGYAGTATATSATSLTATGTPWSVNAYVGCVVISLASGGIYGIVQSNTTSVLTVDRWYDPTNPGGAAATTPGATTLFAILSGAPPAWFVGLTANNSAAAAGDTTLTGEIVTAGGGLVRKIAPFAHTAGTNTYTLTPVYTANGSDSLPVTVAKIGVFSSMVVASTIAMMFETLLSATATLSASGDTLTVTETVTGS